MTVTLLLAGATLRLGLQLRRMRHAKQRRPPDLRRRHLRLAKITVVFVAVGFVAGPISAWLLRDWTAFASFHGWIGTVVAALFFAAAILGRRLERGTSRLLDAHGWLGLIAMLAGGLAAIAGFVLLP
jgi:cytochrome b561